MARLSFAERMRITRLGADKLRRSALSSILHLPPFRWQFGTSTIEQILIVPQDLRTADPSFWDEVEKGEFGLAGSVAVIDENSPFDVAPPSAEWERELHGFAWLRHLAATGRSDARETASLLAAEWVIRHSGGTGVAWEPPVLARRLMSWISHAGLLLEECEPDVYESITESFGMQLVRLNATWRNSPDGYPRMLSLAGLVTALLSVSGHDNQLTEAEKFFTQELSKQILADGGHIGRNPGVLVELMLDLLPLHQCFAARGRPAPRELPELMQKMLDMLKYMRLGDGMLARFNGMSIAQPAGLATVLAYDNRPGMLIRKAPESRYVRVERGQSILIQDVGPPPPLESAAQAHAGCLSFEFSSGTALIFTNGGAPGPASAEWRTASRATASHNALVISDKSSSKLIRDAMLEELLGAPAVRYPDFVTARIEEHGGAIEVTSQHDGYMRKFGLIHYRTLALSAPGTRLVGIDRLNGGKTPLQLKQELPFAIHFHLHPSALCRRGESANIAVIELGEGEQWRFSLEGARLAIEQSTYYADSAGPRRGLQIVARSATYGETEVRWVVERMSDAAAEVSTT